MRWLLVPLAVLLLSPAACKRADQTLCEEACWNGFDLRYHAETEKLLADVPPEQREARRAERTGELLNMKTDPYHGPHQICVEMCTERGSDELARCFLDATTVEQLDACD
jgi:hypothetical protein